MHTQLWRHIGSMKKAKTLVAMNVSALFGQRIRA